MRNADKFGALSILLKNLILTTRWDYFNLCFTQDKRC